MEGLLLRYLIFPVGTFALKPPKALERFRGESDRILSLVRGLPDAQLTAPVLIDRQRGMEDSSRHWSVAMTLQHLLLVGRAIQHSVIQLSAGQEVDRTVSTADVKPSANTPPEVVDEFEQFCTEFPAALEALPYRSSPTLLHPWFGNLSAAKWVTLSAIHQGLHRKQIESILATLPPSPTNTR
jgi:hypothetical protein